VPAPHRLIRSRASSDQAALARGCTHVRTATSPQLDRESSGAPLSTTKATNRQRPDTDPGRGSSLRCTKPSRPRTTT